MLNIELQEHKTLKLNSLFCEVNILDTRLVPFPITTAAHVLRKELKPGETAFDPFSVYGETMVAAHIAKRDVVAGMLSPDNINGYLSVARKKGWRRRQISYCDDRLEFCKGYPDQSFPVVISAVQGLLKDNLKEFNFNGFLASLRDHMWNMSRIARRKVVLLVEDFWHPTDRVQVNLESIVRSYAVRYGLSLMTKKYVREYSVVEDETRYTPLRTLLTFGVENDRLSYSNAAMRKYVNKIQPLNEALIGGNFLKSATFHYNKERGVNIYNTHGEARMDGTFLFNVSGMVANKKVPKIYDRLRPLMLEGTQVPIMLKPSPYIATDGSGGYDENAIKVMFQLPGKDKWYHLGWVPKKIQHEATHPFNKFLSIVLAADSNIKTGYEKCLRAVKLVSFDKFDKNGETIYCAKVVCHIGITALESKLRK